MTLPVKPWRPSFGPLPRHLAGRIPVAPAFIDDIRRAANRFYIDEVAAIAEETDPDIARERAARLDETLNDAVEVARTGVLSPSAARLMEAMEKIGGDKVVEIRSGQSVPVFGDVAFDSRKQVRA